ncbi:UDP-N-acetylglucosamine transporter, putative [Rhizoctonia solani AG-3 Rhs1AP]|uniref:UDP-N-acetylglucosamine transporter, putative n=2 Tax=Rhizoctonia solani AG-3 TaxID=1086053 RepID=X8IZZ2_9AGAM|nr:UDP-N-acetylglucosamine transporter, putative [Rhizoctonia solani AG-3 Rhs1AP]KEP49412.1 putative UDP-N-acetylglucosamine transporter [Rhizoctonia solani 123E]
MQSHISSNYLTSRIRTRNRDDEPLGPSNASAANSNISSAIKQTGAQPWRIKMPVTLAPGLFDFVLAVSLVFGGCCTNAWTLERVLNETPSIGTTLSFLQMLFITVQTLPSVLQWETPSWGWMPLPSFKPRNIPISVWSLQVVLICAISTLNNLTFRYKLPLSIQIVLRSAGLIVSMTLGYLFAGKRYNQTQLLAAVLVTLGVITTTTSKSPSAALHQADTKEYTLGIACLGLSLLGSGVLGLYQERTFAKYGPHWKEGVFYTHAMSLPIISSMWTEITDGWRSLATSSSSHATFYGLNGLHAILVFNIITQAVCVRGVNNLTSQVSSVTTNLVLTARKAASLCLSIWWFGSGVSTRLAIGASCVFAGTVIYAQASSGSTPAPSDEKAPNEKSSS